jgi:hypothetical protein
MFYSDILKFHKQAYVFVRRGGENPASPPCRKMSGS